MELSVGTKELLGAAYLLHVFVYGKLDCLEGDIHRKLRGVGPVKGNNSCNVMLLGAGVEE